VAGRASAFADAEIVKMATEDYVAVACDDWYQRRRQDAEGEFFRKVANQGPRKGQGGSTRQGIYCLTADGQLLIYKNAGQDADVMRDVFRRGLDQWRKLPTARRQPGAVKIEELDKTDPRYVRTPPKDGLALRVFSRLLDRDKGGAYHDADCGGKQGDGPAVDHLWITKEEIQSLIEAAKGARSPASETHTFEVPSTIAQRLLRFHLIDNTRGEPPMWRREDIRRSKLMLSVAGPKSSEAPEVALKLEGSALLATSADPAKADRGYDARLIGEIRLDRAAGRIRAFHVVAVGDHWGEGTYTGGARPGRTPLGVAIELTDGRHPGDSVPPQAAREIQEYFGAAFRR
jgi:hypothetical protein